MYSFKNYLIGISQAVNDHTFKNIINFPCTEEGLAHLNHSLHTSSILSLKGYNEQDSSIIPDSHVPLFNYLYWQKMLTNTYFKSLQLGLLFLTSSSHNIEKNGRYLLYNII